MDRHQGRTRAKGGETTPSSKPGTQVHIKGRTTFQADANLVVTEKGQKCKCRMEAKMSNFQL